jgi:hypothetical protein
MAIMGCAVVALSTGFGAGFSLAAAKESAAPVAQPVVGAWQHRKVTINYFGVTALYSCDGLESQIRQILLYLGARSDLKVKARGCARGPEHPTDSAWILADFYSLVPASDASAPGTVPAYWSPVEINSRNPRFMGDGDCELMESMRDLTVKSFSLKDVDYRTSCVAHQLSLDGYSIKGQTLKASPLKAQSVTDSP